MDESQLEQVRDNFRRMDDSRLRQSYQVYLDSLRLSEGNPPWPSAVQYFIPAWKELRGRTQ